MNRLSLLAVTVLLGATKMPASAASACDVVAAAALKVFQVPAHLYMTRTAGFNKGKTEISESVYANGGIYVMVGGKWVKSSASPKDLADGKKDSDQKLGDCSAVRDEVVSGEMTTLYKIHNVTDGESMDTQMWVSKSRGLPLRQINDIDVGAGAAGKSHSETRYEYTNVTVPAVTQPRSK